ncbi:MAG: DUF2306 domain-containing protein [Rhodobacteraceae bacterium]|nr:DUF2306 domain-containing protein [Paracoccaceae bacterium]
MTRSKPLFYLMACLSVIVALLSFRFLALGIELAFPVFQDNINANMTVFMTHVIASPIALAIAVMQFLPGLRKRRPRLHRWAGRIYAIAVLFGAVSGLMLAYSALDRPVAAMGFGLLAVLWLLVTARAVLSARAGQIAAHRRWMIRSFALTFAAVTLRLQLPVLLGLGMDYPEASNIFAWTCWVPNLLVAEWLVRWPGGPASVQTSA